MYEVKVNVTGKSTDAKDDFDVEANVVYRNVKTVEGVDRIMAGAAAGLFSLGNVKLTVA